MRWSSCNHFSLSWGNVPSLRPEGAADDLDFLLDEVGVSMAEALPFPNCAVDDSVLDSFTPSGEVRILSGVPGIHSPSESSDSIIIRRFFLG